MFFNWVISFRSFLFLEEPLAKLSRNPLISITFSSTVLNFFWGQVFYFTFNIGYRKNNNLEKMLTEKVFTHFPFTQHGTVTQYTLPI